MNIWCRTGAAPAAAALSRATLAWGIVGFCRERVVGMIEHVMEHVILRVLVSLESS